MKKILGHIISSIFTITSLTIREALRKRIIFIILIISSFFLFMNFFCESVTMQANGEEIKDAAIGSTFIFVVVTVWSLVISALVTSSLLADEFENKTYTMILSKPIFRLSYLAGKFLGVFILILVNALIIIAAYSLINFLRSRTMDTGLWLSLVSMLPSYILLISIVLLFTILINRTAAVLLSFALVLLTSIVNYPIYEAAFEKVIETDSSKKLILEVIYWVLPQFGTSLYNSLSKVAKSFSQVHYLGFYAYAQITVWIVLTWVLLYFSFRRRELE
ncbi:MAG: ABC transporter permease subunit [Leptospiraceae bacterium]|nr:ABC transporter permease subunit [Leptospiraceae bacterium]